MRNVEIEIIKRVFEFATNNQLPTSSRVAKYIVEFLTALEVLKEAVKNDLIDKIAGAKSTLGWKAEQLKLLLLADVKTLEGTRKHSEAELAFEKKGAKVDQAQVRLAKANLESLREREAALYKAIEVLGDV